MLQSFRVIINSFVGRVFFTILLGTFALLGVGYGFRDLVLGATASNDAATVGKTAITIAQVDRLYRRQLSEIRRQTNGSFNPTPQQKQELVRAILDKQIDDTLIGDAARQHGFRVGDTLVRDVVQSESSFAGLDKRFDAGKFRMLLENRGMNEATYVSLVRDSLTNQLVINPIVDSAVVPRSVIEDIYRYRNEQRVAQTITIRADSMAGTPAPTDAEIDAYYKAHAADYTAPEYRSFTVLPITPDLFVGEVKITDDDLHAAFEQYKSQYSDPERRKITQVVLNDMATAEAVVKAATSSKSLADAAKTVGDGKAEPVTIDFSKKDELQPALRDAVFSAAKGAFVGPIQGPLGWHVVHVDDIKGHDVTFDEVKAKLVDQVKHDKAIDLLSQRIDKNFGDRLTAGTSMEDLATGAGAKLVKIAQVDVKGAPAALPAGEKPAAPDAAWVAQAFDLQSGETSAFQDDKAGGYFAVRLDGVTAPALRPLAEVRASIVSAWTKEKQTEAAIKKAEDLAAKAKIATDFAKFAADAGLKVESNPAITRVPADKTAAPPALSTALFRLEKVGDITAVATDDGAVVARLSEIRPADPKAAGDKLKALIGELEGGIRADAMAQYQAGLRTSTKIKVNPQAVDSVAGQ